MLSRGANGGSLTKKKVAILTNIVPPYRLALYRHLSRWFTVEVYTSGVEPNRTTWSRNIGVTSEGLAVSQSWGFTLNHTKSEHVSVYDRRYLHINPGYIVDLLRSAPDAIITTEMGFRTLAAIAYSGLFRRPVWVWWGGTKHTERHAGLARRALRNLIVRSGPRWISYGESSTEYLRSIGVSRSRILQVQNCVDENLYRTSVETRRHISLCPVILAVGQMLGRKGFDRLLTTVARLQRRNLDFSLLLVGDGPDRIRLETMARNLHLKNVSFKAAVPASEMVSVYRNADCLVLPTLQDVWGLVVNEALWSGLPVLCSIYAGCARELLPEEALFDPLDESDFEKALTTAIDGRVPAPDHSRLRTCEGVAQMIARTLSTALNN